MNILIIHKYNIYYIIKRKKKTTFFTTLTFTYFLHDPQMEYDFQFSTFIFKQFQSVNNILLID